MKLIIDIDETKLTTIKHCYVTFGKDLFDLENYIIECVKNGKPYKETPQGELITEEQAIDKLHETGWLIRHDKEMTVNKCDNCDLMFIAKTKEEK